MTAQAIILMNPVTGTLRRFPDYAAAADFLTGKDPRQWIPAAPHRG